MIYFYIDALQFLLIQFITIILVLFPGFYLLVIHHGLFWPNTSLTSYFANIADLRLSFHAMELKANFQIPRRPYFRPTTVSQRQLLFEEVGKTGNVTRSALKAHVGRGTYYHWKSRYEAEGMAGLVEVGSRAPRRPRISPIRARYARKCWPITIAILKRDTGRLRIESAGRMAGRR